VGRDAHGFRAHGSGVVVMVNVLRPGPAPLRKKWSGSPKSCAPCRRSASARAHWSIVIFKAQLARSGLFVGFSDDRRLVVLRFVVAVFVLVIIIVWITRRHRVGHVCRLCRILGDEVDQAAW
jgi:hypothetical protein